MKTISEKIKAFGIEWTHERYELPADERNGIAASVQEHYRSGLYAIIRWD